jgi:probable HAF family extracellular repeat protein
MPYPSLHGSRRRRSDARHGCTVVVAVVAVLLSATRTASAFVSCIGLGFLSSEGAPGSWSVATSVSADGSVVVGYDIGNGDVGQRAFRWTEQDGMQSLNLHPDGGEAVVSSAMRVSADGKVIVGWMSDRNGGTLDPFRWTRETGMENLGHLPGTNPAAHSSAYGVNGDGAIVVGNNTQAFRWTLGTGLQALGVFLAQSHYNDVQAISADGSTIIGRGPNAKGQLEPFRWTAAGGVEGLGLLAPADPQGQGYAQDVNTDGSVIVGMSLNERNFWEPFRWTHENGLQPLGFLGNPAVNGGATWDPRGPSFGAKFESSAFAVSADGKTVVGKSVNPHGDYEPFIWTEAGGMRDLGPLLGGASFGEEIGEGDANGISADGSIVVGMAPNRTNGLEAFRCRIR